MSFAAPNRRLYVGRIHQDASRIDLEDHFATVGPRPSDVKILNGYGFIEFETLSDAEAAKDQLDNRDFMGDRLLVQFAKASERRPRYDDGPGRGGDSYRGPAGRDSPRGPREQGWRLLISNLPNGCSWQDLKDFARTAGNVHYTEVSRSEPSEGVIEYLSHSDAENAIKALDGVDMRGSVVRVVENTAPPGQTWANPRASPPRRDDGGDRRGGGDRGYGGGGGDRGYGGGDRGYGGRRERSRSPPRRRDDRDDRDRPRGGGGGRDDDRDRRGGSSRREKSRSRSPPRYTSNRDRSRSPR